MPNRFFTLENGPDRELAEQGVYRRGGRLVRTGLDANTGGPLPPRPGTGGGLPPSGGIIPRTGGGLPPTAGGIIGRTGGPLPPSPAPVPTGANTGGTLPPLPVPVPTGATTGGGLPPSGPVPTGATTGGVLPPSRVPVPPNASTGGGLPPSRTPVPPNAHTGGGLPPSRQPLPNARPMEGSFAPVDVVNQMIEGLMQGRVGQNARQRGVEFANSRGLLNSSIAAGNAERAALEAINPYVSEGMGLLRQREQNAFEGEQTDKRVFQQDWLNSRNFNREFYSALSMIPINNASQFSQMIAQYALENPEVYTPDNIAGMSKFFNDNFRYLMSQYLGDIDLGGL